MELTFQSPIARWLRAPAGRGRCFVLHRKFVKTLKHVVVCYPFLGDQWARSRFVSGRLDLAVRLLKQRSDLLVLVPTPPFYSVRKPREQVLHYVRTVADLSAQMAGVVHEAVGLVDFFRRTPDLGDIKKKAGTGGVGLVYDGGPPPIGGYQSVVGHHGDNMFDPGPPRLEMASVVHTGFSWGGGMAIVSAIANSLLWLEEQPDEIHSENRSSMRIMQPGVGGSFSSRWQGEASSSFAHATTPATFVPARRLPDILAAPYCGTTSAAGTVTRGLLRSDVCWESWDGNGPIRILPKGFQEVSKSACSPHSH